jgi:thioredoxin-like negative regulator of GroEL
MLEQLLVIISLLLAASAAGLWWKKSQGRARRTESDISPRLLVAGHWLTLVQVSSPLCSYCAAMRGILQSATTRHEGVAHIEYDISDIPEVVDTFGVRQTPTTFLVEADGRVAHQIGGATNPRAIDELIELTRADVEQRADEYEI